MEYDFQSEDLINMRERFAPPRRLEPKIDTLISGIVGIKVYALDPRVIKLVAKWKQKKNNDAPDDFLHNSVFIQELRQELGKSL